MFASLGLAGLTKALLGFGLPCAIIGLHAILSGRWRYFLSWRTGAGIIIAAAVLAPWHVLVARANPDFLWYYFIREHFLRLTGQRFPRDEFLSAPLFLAFTLLWVFPWIGVVPTTLSRAFRRLREEGWARGRHLLPVVWMLLIIGLFTASQSRLEYYSLPAIPAFALLIGKLRDEAMRGEIGNAGRIMTATLSIFSIFRLLGALAAWEVLGPAKKAVFEFLVTWRPESGWSGAREQMALLESIRIPTTATLAGSALLMPCASASYRLSHYRSACALLLAIMTPFHMLTDYGFTIMEPFISSRPLVEILRGEEWYTFR